tara:strand:+ start:246 stop:443 length:198 start_codon:yes stop_codon:yes gene_type:complete
MLIHIVLFKDILVVLEILNQFIVAVAAVVLLKQDILEIQVLILLTLVGVVAVGKLLLLDLLLRVP